MAKIIEQFLQGKSPDPALCEDKIVVTNDFIAVIDGATSREGFKLEGMSNGAFAAHVLADGIASLPADITGKQAVLTLTDLVRTRTDAAAKAEGRALTDIWSYPAAALLVYSKQRREIWRVADSTFVVDGVPTYKTFLQEKAWSDVRKTIIHAKLARGATLAELQANDPTWDVLTGMIAECKIFANNTGLYSYGVFNGAPIPDEHIEIYAVPNAREIVFASDGYPEVFTTLAESEDALNKLITADPLMYQIIPQVKGVKTGNFSFDDRSYIRFTVD